MLKCRMRIGKKRKSSDIRLQVIENARYKINLLKKGLSSSNQEDNAIQFFHIIKKFFSSFFSLPYNLSYEEIKNSVSGKIKNEPLKKEILSFLNSVSLMEFSGLTPSGNRISYFSRKFISLLSLIADSEIPNSRESVIKKSIKLIEEKLGISGQRKKAEEESIEQIYRLLLLGHKSISVNELPNAKAIYSQVRALYSKLSPEGKQRMYSEILYFYRKIN
jgi:hypothetical protein